MGQIVIFFVNFIQIYIFKDKKGEKFNFFWKMKIMAGELDDRMLGYLSKKKNEKSIIRVHNWTE